MNIELLTAMSGGKWLNDYSVAANPACNHPVCTAMFDNRAKISCDRYFAEVRSLADSMTSGISFLKLLFKNADLCI